MVEGNVREFRWALEGEDTLRRELEPEARKLLASVESDSANPLGDDYALSPEDQAAVGQGGIRAMLATAFREGIGRGIDGIVDDDLAFVEPWGFDVSAIGLPVSVWYGPHDTLVPTAHGEWLAGTIPGAQTFVMDGGHFAVYERLPELLAWLTEDSR
jgi:pimeloyl-ACP methyl ester carboxylesterase